MLCVLILGSADILLMAEYFATNLAVSKARITLVHPGTGYSQVARDIMSGRLSLDQAKVIVLLVGRADVLDWSVKVQENLMQVRRAINARDPAIILLACTPLPWPQDSEAICRKLY